MLLIIGKNSALVNRLNLKRFSAHYVTHKQLDETQLSNYSRIVVFSWSKTDNADNILLINKLPLEKVVFISSAAVYSLKIRPQWAKYPSLKFDVEKHVLSGNGIVLRIGITDSRLLSVSNGIVPFTKITDIEDCILSISNYNSGVYDIFQLRQGGIAGIRKTILLSLIFVSLRLPSKIVFQSAFYILTKIIGVIPLNYNSDMSLAFAKTLEVELSHSHATSYAVLDIENSRARLQVPLNSELLIEDIDYVARGSYESLVRNGHIFKLIEHRLIKPCVISNTNVKVGAQSSCAVRFVHCNGYWRIYWGLDSSLHTTAFKLLFTNLVK